MKTDLSKFCADFLRSSCAPKAGETCIKLKASHARELVAAFFGYKSHAALILEKDYPLDNLEEAEILVPDVSLLNYRRSCLKELPTDLASSQELASRVVTFLTEEGYFNGEVWLSETLEEYVADQLLVDIDEEILEQLSGVMANTNAGFYDYPEYKEREITDQNDALIIRAAGTYHGEQRDERLFAGNIIDFGVQVTLWRIAGKRGFRGLEIEAGGSVRDDWCDIEDRYGTPNVRPKEQFLRMTGGFRVDETHDQFQGRQAEIHTIRNRIAKREVTQKDIDRLSHLLGADEDAPSI